MPNYYADLPPIHSLEDATRSSSYHPAPDHWALAITDVQNSTKAIADGRYKDVNAIAAASIAALINALPHIDLPFVFGGDGTSLLFPADQQTAVEEALRGTIHMAREHFDLHLRAGIIPLADVRAAGYAILVARWQVSGHFHQAIFAGGGLAYADSLLKVDTRYHISPDGPHTADFSGFECRWNSIPSRYDETISLIVRMLGDAPAEAYADILARIEQIYGDNAQRHPLTPNTLRLALNPANLSVESRVRHGTRALRRLLKMAYQSLIARLAMRFDIDNWGSYKDYMLTSTDHEKLDDALYMTISGTATQRATLCAYLDEEHAAGRLVYGVHVASHALVTCIVYDYFGQQMHFVDTTQGGYALAARHMKTQLAAL